MHVKLTSSKRLFDIWQETSNIHIADEQTLLKIRHSDVNITSNRRLRDVRVLSPTTPRISIQA